jgi:uncharacterized RDD family membrane protein YckC
MPDPAFAPELLAGVRSRRIAAYFIDLCCIAILCVGLWILAAVLTVLSLGLLGPPLHLMLLLVPVAYNAVLLSAPGSATIGMRCFGIELRSWTGERPVPLQATVQTVLFYVTVGATGSLILLFALFNRRKRTLHDVLAGTIVVRTLPRAWGWPRARRHV